MKDKKKSLRTTGIAHKEEMQGAGALIIEGSKRLANAIAKHDFKEASVASALIDGTRKKIEKAKTEGDQKIKMRKDIDERKQKMMNYLSKHRKNSKHRLFFAGHKEISDFRLKKYFFTTFYACVTEYYSLLSRHILSLTTFAITNRVTCSS